MQQPGEKRDRYTSAPTTRLPLNAALSTGATGLVDRLCSDQVARWRDGERIPAESYLERHPELEENEESFFELIYGEYLIRESLGEPPDVESFTARFPRYAARIRRQLSLHEAFRDEDLVLPAEPPPTLQPGSASGPRIPGYDLLGELGRGAVGVVYRAKQHGLNRLVALKVIRAWIYNDPEVAARFRAEAETAAKFQHPNIIQVYVVGEYQGQGYLALEYADGGSLHQRLAGVPQKPADAARLVETLALAVHYAHQRGIVHRDLKPANVVLTQDGVPKVTDFGLAKLVQKDEGMTCTGDVLGTPNYMAPEQARGASEAITPATDVYSLGAILYEAITGRPPFQGSTPLSVLDQVNHHEPLAPGRLQRQTPRELETVCLKCLEKDPRKRYASAFDLADDLRRFLEGRAVKARRVGVWGRLWRWSRREPMKAGLLGALVLAMVVGFAVTAVLWGRAETKAVQAALAESAARDHLYVSQIARARLEWRLNDVKRAERILEECEATRRDWEWRHLRDVNHPEILALESSRHPFVTATAFSPDGTRLAFTRFNPYLSYEVDQAHPAPIEVVEFATGKTVQTLPGVPQAFYFEFSPDGLLLAVSGGYGDVAVWDLKESRKLHEWTKSRPAGFSRDGKRLVTGDKREIQIRDTATGAILRHFDAQGGRASFSPDDRSLALSGVDDVEILDAESGATVVRLPHGPGEAEARIERFFSGQGPDFDFSPDGSMLLVSTNPPKVWNVSTGQPVYSLVGHNGNVLGVAFGPDGRQVATAGVDATVRIWDARNGAELGVFRGHAEFVACVAFHPEGWALASGGRTSGDVKVWDLTRNPEYRAIRSISSVAVVYDEKLRIHSVDGQGKLVIHDPLTDKSESGATVDLTKDWLTPAVLADFSDDGARLATITSDRRVVKLWESATGRELATLRGLSIPATVVDVSADGGRVAAIGIKPGDAKSKRELRVWESLTGAPLATFEVGRHPSKYTHGAVALSPDGNQVAYDDYEGETEETARSSIKIRDLADGRIRLALPFEEWLVLSLTFSADGRMIAAANLQGAVTVWDRATGAVLGAVPQQDSPIFRLAFSPDGKRLAGVQRDMVLIWDIHEGRELLNLRIASRRALDGGYNPTVAWSKDARMLANSNWDGSLSLWDGPEQPASTTDRFKEARNRSFGWHVAEAEAAAGQGLVGVTSFHVERVRKATPPDDTFRLRRARLMMKLADWKGAETDYAALLASGECRESLVWLGAARSALVQGDIKRYADLRAEFIKLNTIHPNAIDPAHAALFLGMGPGSEPERTLRFAHEAMTLRPSEPFSHLVMGLALFRDEQWEPAIREITTALEKAPSLVARGQPLLAAAHSRLNRSQEAKNLLAEVDSALKPILMISPADEPSSLVSEDSWDALIFYREARTSAAESR